MVPSSLLFPLFPTVFRCFRRCYFAALESRFLSNINELMFAPFLRMKNPARSTEHGG